MASSSVTNSEPCEKLTIAKASLTANPVCAITPMMMPTTATAAITGSAVIAPHSRIEYSLAGVIRYSRRIQLTGSVETIAIRPAKVTDQPVARKYISTTTGSSRYQPLTKVGQSFGS